MELKTGEYSRIDETGIKQLKYLLKSLISKSIITKSLLYFELCMKCIFNH